MHALIRDYVRLLEGAEGRAIMGLVADTAVFQSPFSLWQDHAGVSGAFLARSRAFSGLQVTDIAVGEAGTASLRWSANVDGEHVEGGEFLTIADGQITRVDVFLRPAAVLDTVYAAMAAAWPRSR